MPVVTATTSASNLPRQLSDDNSLGTVLGQNATDLISFYGATPIAQPSGPAEASVARGQAAGVIATYTTTQSPVSGGAAPNTTSEAGLTIQSGTGFTMQILAGDVLFINTPTAPAGLGYGNVRVSTSNVAGVTFSNSTAATITPTASQAYQLVALRGISSISATLSPAAVQPNSTVEQQFPVTGVVAGQLVQVNKPSSQAGIDIVGCRAVANNVLGITFANLTAATVTPTASESYTISSLAGIDSINNQIMYGFNVGTVGAIAGGIVITGGSTTLTGLLASDVVVGIQKPTAQAAATNAAGVYQGIPTLNTLTLYFLGVGSGATPTASEVYGVNTFRAAPVAPLLLYTTSLNPISVAANTTAEQSFTVTGLVAGSPVWINKPTFTNGIGIVGVRVSSANTLAVTYANSSSAAIIPPTETYIIGNFQVPGPGAGNVVYQTASPLLQAVGNATDSIRAGLVSLGLLAGA